MALSASTLGTRADLATDVGSAARRLPLLSHPPVDGILDALPDQVWTARPDGSLDYVNKRVSDYFAPAVVDVREWDWLNVLHPEDVDPTLQRWIACLTEGSVYETAFRLRRGSDGSYRWHIVRAYPQRDERGQIYAWFGSNTDVDDLYAARAQEAAQRRALEHLNQESARIAKEREALIQALEASNHELDQFAYVASHDLKAPLRGINSLSEWIEEDLAERITDEAREHLRLLRGRVQRLELLIDGILTYARAGRRQDNLTAVDSGALVAETIALLAPPAHAVVRAEGPFPTLTTDRVQLQQVLLNLIGNAIKYGHREGVAVRITASTTDGEVTFRVADDGPGIAPEYHERIWGIFQTLLARDQCEGTGIGLSVVRKIVEARGKRAWLDSRPGAGSSFFFTWERDARSDT